MGTGAAFATGDVLTAAKVNLKLESVVDADVEVGAAIVGSKLATNGQRRHAKAFAKLDLSGSAQADVVILHAITACTLVKVELLYTEASSGDAGVTVTVGKETDPDYYYTGTSEISKAAWYTLDVTLLATDLAAGDTLICGHAGSKSGTGEILVCAEYTVDD
jgi:hypothetical protein